MSESLSTDDPLFTTETACDYLQIRRPTLYRLTSHKSIPFIRLSARKLLFRKSDLDDWLSEKRVEAV